MTTQKSRGHFAVNEINIAVNTLKSPGLCGTAIELIKHDPNNEKLSVLSIGI